tara:strand:- start:342 stop:956 length:615 start_codon:yes stop_codon:yes gene_type:complete
MYTGYRYFTDSNKTQTTNETLNETIVTETGVNKILVNINEKMNEYKIVLPYCLKEKLLTKYYKLKFSNEVMKELKDNYYSPIPYLDMGYVVRYCPDDRNILFGNELYQCVQNYFEFLYGYKDYTEEFTKIISSIKNMYLRSDFLPIFMYESVLDDYHYPGGHSGGSFSICARTLYHLIKINTKKISKKDKIASWIKYCVINRFY